MVVLAVLHMLRVILYGAYKYPREVTWLTGIALLLIVIGFGFTGYLLPWDQKAFWQRPSAHGSLQSSRSPATATYDDVAQILRAKCVVCDGAAGGWDASTYDSVMHSGDNAPVIVPGDPDGSLLVQKLLGTQTEGGPMPPGPSLSEADIATILAWIMAGATQ